MSEMVEQVTWTVCPILLAADECDMPQIINGPRPECRKCPAVESRGGGTAGCRIVAEMVARAAIAAMRVPTPAMRDAVGPWIAYPGGGWSDDECDSLIEEVIDAALVSERGAEE